MLLMVAMMLLLVMWLHHLFSLTRRWYAVRSGLPLRTIIIYQG